MMQGIPVATKDLHQKLKLYLFCCPTMDLQVRFLPRSGGLYEQDFIDVMYFEVIENRIKEIIQRKK